MSNTYYWADLHFGHRLVAAHRRFRDIADHDQAIIDAWDVTVTDHDTIYILGDISSGSATGTRTALARISERPGRKVLIAGNHDDVHPMNRPRPATLAAWAEVFDHITPVAYQKINGRRFLLSHFPYAGAGDHSEEERFTQWRLPDLGMPLVHGHVHRKWSTNGHQLNVGVDYNTTPVPLRDIERWVLSQPEVTA